MRWRDKKEHIIRGRWGGGKKAKFKERDNREHILRGRGGGGKDLLCFSWGKVYNPLALNSSLKSLILLFREP